MDSVRSRSDHASDTREPARAQSRYFYDFVALSKILKFS